MISLYDKSICNISGYVVCLRGWLDSLQFLFMFDNHKKQELDLELPVIFSAVCFRARHKDLKFKVLRSFVEQCGNFCTIFYQLGDYILPTSHPLRSNPKNPLTRTGRGPHIILYNHHIVSKTYEDITS